MHTCFTKSEKKKKCIWFWVILPLFYQLFSTFSTLFFPFSITIRIDTLWAQLLLEFSTDHFETMHTCSTSSEDGRLVLGFFSCYFLSTFILLFQFTFFPGLVKSRIDTLWAQLLLQSPDHFDAMHPCSTWSEDVRVVFGHPSINSFFNIFHFSGLVI